MLVGEPGQQTRTGVFQEVEHMLEAFGTAIIGVGHVVGVGVAGAVIGHAAYLVASLDGGGAVAQVVDVAVVHADDEVELKEIVGGHGARTVGEVVAAAGGVGTHTAIGQLALVIGKDAGRVYMETVGQTGLIDKPLHDPLGRRRTADVAETYKENLILHPIEILVIARKSTKRKSSRQGIGKNTDKLVLFAYTGITEQV